MVPILVIAFILVPLAELAVLIAVGEWIGLVPTLILLLLVSVAGAWLAKREGLVAWRRFQQALAEGRVPAREVLDGALVIFGGAFLITPGFITDVIGVLLLLPPTRALFRRMLVRRFTSGLVVSVAGAATARRRARRDYDVEGTAAEHDQERLGR
jgi:UPF0716 protein FxsA